MSAVTSINSALLSIECPDLLRGKQAWVVWRYEHVEGSKKPRKVPYYANGGKRHGVQGRPEDRQQMVTFEAARTAAARRNMDGVGFCLLPEFNITALDFDHCVVDGKLLPEIEQLVAGTYAEWSPSGEGVRAFVRGNLGNHSTKPTGSTIDTIGFQTFFSSGYVTITGNVLEVTELTGARNTVAALSDDVQSYCQRRFERERLAETDLEPLATAKIPPIGVGHEVITDALDPLPLDCDYDYWIKVGMAVHHETRGEGFEIWDAKFQASPKYTSREYGWERWRSFGRHERQVTFRWLAREANKHGAHIDLASFMVADFEVLDEEEIQAPPAPAVEGKKLRFTPISVADYLDRPRPQWIVKELVPKAELGVIYGDPGSGKTFIALDLLLHIALGLPWRGLRVKRQRVIYVVAEGAGAFGLRLRAWLERNQVDARELDGWFELVADAPDLLDKDQALDLARRIKEAGGAGLVVVDTLARVTPGANENSSEDMGLALAHCKGLHKALRGAMVILIHHSGKDATRGARGWSGIKGAADMELEVRRSAAGRMLQTTKAKDGRDDLAFAFELDVVPVGVDEDGDAVTSCAVRELDALPVQQAMQKQRKLGTNEQLVVEAFTATLARTGETDAAFDAVIELAIPLAPEPTPGKRDTRKQNLSKALLGLCGEGSEPKDPPLFRLEEGRVYAL